MPKITSIYVCQQCGYKSPQYLGKCPQCDSWNSLVEEAEEVGYRGQVTVDRKKAQIINLSEIKQVDYQRLTTKMEEFDRVLGGGIVLGSVNLVAGDPGIGKSTLLTQLALNMEHVLYVAGEESAEQIKLRLDRMKNQAHLLVLNETDVDVVIQAIVEEKPKVVIVDSIQTLQTADLSSVAGSIGQVRECTHRLQKVAKALHIPLFLVGHVTKEGGLAGPKSLEHVVDVVLSLEGDSTSMFRILRSTKNRFGPTDEVGIFEMVERGMMEVKNPSRLFLNQRVNAPGSAVVPVLTGLRPLLIEIQALVTKTTLPVSRRTAAGVDYNRLQLLVAVLQKRLGLPLWDQDIFVNVTGGLNINEPAADLAICLAIISSFRDQVIDPKVSFIGEVGLLGEIREVKGLEKRMIEAKKLGFTKVISFQNAKTLAQVTRMWNNSR